MTRFRFGVLAVVATCAACASALPAAAAHARRAPAAAATVTVTAAKPSEFQFTLSAQSVRRGTVVFRVVNRGRLPHDFQIAGRRTKVIAPGASQTLRVTFRKAGSYPFLCTVPGHAAAGMRGMLRVT